MTVTIYTHHDTAGPGLNLTGNNLARLLQILGPCLVNGYAGKPAAGWSLVQNLANGFTLSRAAGGAVNFTRTTQYGLMVYLMESMTSGAASPPTGQNLRSQNYSASSNSSDTNRQWIAFFDTTVVKSWLVAATADAFLLHVRWVDSVNDLGFGNSLTFFCGAAKLHSGLPVAQNMTALSGQSMSVSSGSGVSSYLFEAGFTVLRDPLTGAAISGAGLAMSGTPSRPAQQTTYLTPVPPALPPVIRLNPLHLSYGTSFVGFVPGILYDSVIGQYDPAGLMAALGFTPTVEAWKSPKVIDGHNVWPLPTGWGLLFITDDAGAW